MTAWRWRWQHRRARSRLFWADLDYRRSPERANQARLARAVQHLSRLELRR